MKAFVDVGVSLDGYIAGPNRDPGNPFRAPVFVLTHSARQAWSRKGGTTFFFVTDGIESALHQATAATHGKDVRISGGAATVAQYLDAGLVDELALHVAPVLLADGVRLFEQTRPDAITLAQAQTSSSPLATHIRYTITRP